VRFSASLNGTDALFLTKLDTLTGIDELQVCVGYKLDGKAVQFAELEGAGMSRVEPVYKTSRGWREDIHGIRKFADLPKNAQHYVEFIEKFVGVPVRYIGTGPEREAVIKR
jgi:adenylosuccinate synthase